MNARDTRIEDSDLKSPCVGIVDDQLGPSDWSDAAIDRIKHAQIDHRVFNVTTRQLATLCKACKGGECIALTGPSRAGKSKLIENMANRLNPPTVAELMCHRPVVNLSCRNRGDNGLFTTKDFYIEALERVNHPFYTLDSHDLQINYDTLRRRAKDTDRLLSYSLEYALQTLGVRYLVIDETQHLLYARGGSQGALRILEMLKTLAEQLQCVLVLVGAYPILQVLHLSPHLIGREFLIEMPRYKSDVQVDLEEFEALLEWYTEGIRFEHSVVGLRDWNLLLYEQSYGVVGNLSARLRDALARMQAVGDDQLSLRHVLGTRKPQWDLKQVKYEIDVGEQYLQQDQSSASSAHTAKTGTSNDSVKSRQRRKPYETNPVRRPSGGRLV